MKNSRTYDFIIHERDLVLKMMIGVNERVSEHNSLYFKVVNRSFLSMRMRKLKINKIARLQGLNLKQLLLKAIALTVSQRMSEKNFFAMEKKY